MKNPTGVIAPLQPLAGIAILIAVALAMASIALFLPPLPQPLAFHDFVEQRMIFGIPHFGDVVSNVAYVIASLLGFAFLASRDGRTALTGLRERLPYIVFFAAVGAVAVGSTYYHFNPTNQTLFWDRLPMTVAFTAILAAFLADRVHMKVATQVILPLAVTLGVLSLLYWNLSEMAGFGDLRFYFLVQAAAFVLIPLTCLLFPGRHTSGKFVVYILALYGLGVACEQLDAPIYDVLGGAVSGHTIKHVFTATAVYMVVPMLRRSGAAPIGSRTAPVLQ